MKEMMTVRSVRNIARFSSRCLFSGDDELFSCLSLFFLKKKVFMLDVPGKELISLSDCYVRPCSR